jgi:hypothetical protein
VTATANGSYSGTSGATPWTISKATPAGTLTWATPAAITYGTALNATQLDASSTLPGSFVYTPAAGAVLNAGTQTLSVTFTPTDTTDYTSATATVSLVVNPEPVTFTVTPVSFPYNGSSQGPTITPSPAGATFGTTGATSATLRWELFPNGECDGELYGNVGRARMGDHEGKSGNHLGDAGCDHLRYGFGRNAAKCDGDMCPARLFTRRPRARC